MRCKMKTFIVSVKKIKYSITQNSFLRDYDYLNEKQWYLYQTQTQGVFFFTVLPFGDNDIYFLNGVHRFIGKIERIASIKQAMSISKMHDQ